MRGERSLGIGAAFAQHVERVAGEHDDRRAATSFDGVRDRSYDFPGGIGAPRHEPKPTEHEDLTADCNRERNLVDHRRPPGRKVDES